MISRVRGKVIEKGNNYLHIDTGGLCYEVLVPETVMSRLSEAVLSGQDISLKTFHYLQVDQSKSIPVLIGFLNDIEKDFFEIFITVSGIGPKAALRALNKPISQIARAIDEADLVFLKSLPGIGTQRAKEIVAKLQNKVARFGLIQDASGKPPAEENKDITDEAVSVLMRLEYKKPEALVMVKNALERGKDIQTTEQLLNEVYKQRKA